MQAGRSYLPTPNNVVSLTRGGIMIASSKLERAFLTRTVTLEVYQPCGEQVTLCTLTAYADTAIEVCTATESGHVIYMARINNHDTVIERSAFQYLN